MSTITFSGLASGIDSESLIKATSEATRIAKVNPKEEKVTQMESENSSLEELKTMLNDLKDIVDGFSSINGGAVAKSGTSSDETVVAASASKMASRGSYVVEVEQLARNSSFAFISDNPYTDVTDKINSNITEPQTVSMTIGSPSVLETISVEVTNSTTLSDFVNKFNEQSDYAVASLVNKGTPASPDYVVMVVAENSGSEKGIASVTIPDDLKTGGVWDTGCVMIEGKDALLNVNGVDLVRSSNTINDVISGVTFTLNSIGSAFITVDTDKETTEANLQEFVDLYNDIIEYITKNDKVERDESGDEVSNTYGSLAKTNVDENLMSSLRTDISSAKIAAGKAVRIMADLGITTKQDGTLNFDTDVLAEALENNADDANEVTKALGDKMGLTSGTINIYIRFNGLIDLSINNNKTEISDLNERISRAEEIIAQKEEAMRRRFARLESTMSNLQSTQTSLTSMLSYGTK